LGVFERIRSQWILSDLLAISPVFIRLTEWN
jgi:hypothetical protein